MRVLFFTLLLAFYAFAADAAGVLAGSVVDTAAETEGDDDGCGGDDCGESDDEGDEDDGDSSVVDSAAMVQARLRNIPLPRQTAYTGKGLSIGVGAGVYNPTEDCDCMGIWQGQLEYFYREWISLSIDVRFFGGDLDSDVMVMYQRYRLDLRFHQTWKNVALFIEPVLGFENTSISEFRNEMRHHGKQPVAKNEESDIPSWVTSVLGDSLDRDSLPVPENDGPCERMLSLDGFSVGVGGGVGVNLSRLWGVTGSVLWEYNFSRAMQLSLVPGVAFNLREIWPWAKKNLFSTWISFEFGAQRYFNKGIRDWSNYGLIGFQLGI